MKLIFVPEGPFSFADGEYRCSEGTGVYLDNLAPHFSEISIYAYVFRPGDADYEAVAQYRFRSKNIRCVPLPFAYGRAVGLLQKCFQLLGVARVLAPAIRGCDMLYLFLPGYPGAIAHLLARMLHKPYILYLASEWGEESPVLFPWSGIRRRLLLRPFHRLNVRLEHSAVRRARVLLTAGRATYEKYKSFGVPIEETVPRINWETLSVRGPKAPRDDGEFKVLYVGALLARKGVAYLLEALAMLGERGRKEISLSVVGSGEERENLQTLALGLGLQERVRFLDYVPNGPGLFDLYDAADAFVLPTPFGEGFPRVLYEAMARGVPIVATRVSGVPYVMRHEENALLVPPRSAQAIAEALERLADDPALQARLSENARRQITRIFERRDGGAQVRRLLLEHLPEYRAWAEAR